MFTNYTSLVIPTRNRLKKLSFLLKRISLLKYSFQEIIVVDSSDKKYKDYLKKLCRKYSAKFYSSEPSTAGQRNFGIKIKNKKNKYIMFMDDDIIFEKNTFFKLDQVINKYRNNNQICGFGLNLIGKKDNVRTLDFIKESNIVKSLGLYSNIPGSVTKSGWHTKIKNLKQDSFVDWLYSTGCVYKCKLIKNIEFDNSLGVYSYLEDLDFSLQLKRRKLKLIIAHLAKFKHPNDIERTSFNFGVLEIVNRYKIVKKYYLNKELFFLGAIIRSLISFLSIFKGNINYFFRGWGNIFGILKCLVLK
jgi:glycosyltransferase involved in cell wall biosynthesis